jgi:hypothetical protein
MPRTVVFLSIAGLLLLAIGGAILLAPAAFHGSNGIALGDNPNLLSEIRAPGGLLVGSGIIILIGAFRKELRIRAVQLTALVYGSFGVARLVSIALDGLPSTSIVAAAALELTVALVGIAILWRKNPELEV